MKLVPSIITASLLGCVIATYGTSDDSSERSDPFQISNFTADVLDDHTTIYAFDLIYHPGVPFAHCSASSPPSAVDCTGNLCVSYGSCGAPVNATTNTTNTTLLSPVSFNISPDADGTGLVVSIQSNYPQDAALCDSCSKSGLGKLEDAVEWSAAGVQVYTGLAEFSVDAVLTVYAE